MKRPETPPQAPRAYRRRHEPPPAKPEPPLPNRCRYRSVIPRFPYTRIYAQRPPLLGLSGGIFCTNCDDTNTAQHPPTFSNIMKNTIIIFRFLGSFFDIFSFFWIFWMVIHVFWCFFPGLGESVRQAVTFWNLLGRGSAY